MKNLLILLSKSSADGLSFQFMLGVLIVIVGTVATWFLWAKFSRFVASLLVFVAVSGLLYLSGYKLSQQMFFIWTMVTVTWFMIAVIHLIIRKKEKVG